MKLSWLAFFAVATNRFAVGHKQLQRTRDEATKSDELSTLSEEDPDVGILSDQGMISNDYRQSNLRPRTRFLSTYQVGYNSCPEEDDACTEPVDTGTVIVGDNSCRGSTACRRAGNEGYFKVGNDGCIGDEACEQAGMFYGNFTAGNGVCSGDDACKEAGFYGSFTVGDSSCYNKEACRQAGYANNANFEAGRYSCTGEASCLNAARLGNFTVGDRSCDGKNACTNAGFFGTAIVGTGSCIGDNACLPESNFVSFTVGNGSCTCTDCCLGLKDGSHIGDYQCTSPADGCSNSPSPVTRPIPSAAPSESYSPTSAPSVSGSPTPLTNEWRLVFFEDFENGFGAFNDGGKDAEINDNIAHDSTKSLRLRRDSTSSKATSDAFAVAGFNRLQVSFYFQSRNFGDGIDFLLEQRNLKTSDGTWESWEIIGQWVKGTPDFPGNNNWYVANTEVSLEDVEEVKIRFRCNGENINDKLFIDDVKVEKKFSTDIVIID